MIVIKQIPIMHILKKATRAVVTRTLSQKKTKKELEKLKEADENLIKRCRDRRLGPTTAALQA